VDKHPHHGNPDVAAAVLKRKEAQHVAWAYQRGEDYNYGRGFGFTGAHFHENWASLDARRLVLNAIAWIAKVDVPKNGSLQQRSDDKRPAPKPRLPEARELGKSKESRTEDGWF
jgi:hypothetical protein